jgi:hypothetical protein
MMMDRRQVLILGGTGILAGCAGQSPATVTTEVVNDITTAAAALQVAEPALEAIKPPPPGMTPSVIAAIQSGTQQIVTLGGQVTATSTAAAGLATAQQIESILESLVTVGAEVAPPPYGTALAAAAVLLPLAIASLQTILGQVNPTPAPATAKMLRMRATMTPEMARAQLRQIIAQYKH